MIILEHIFLGFLNQNNTELLRIFRLGLPYKYIHFKKIGAFRLKHIFFMSQKIKKSLNFKNFKKKDFKSNNEKLFLRKENAS